jgi:hypothetical protein
MRHVPDDLLTAPLLTPGDRLDRTTGATRRLGTTLFVNVGGAAGAVERLSGSGPALWDLFDEGLSIGEASDRLARIANRPRSEVEEHVLAFAQVLVDAGLRARRQ